MHLQTSSKLLSSIYFPFTPRMPAKDKRFKVAKELNNLKRVLRKMLYKSANRMEKARVLL